MEKSRSRLRIGAALTAATVLSACETVNSIVGIAEPAELVAACPTFGRAADADRLIRFDGGVGDPARVLYEAEIIDVAALCERDDDEFEAAVGMRVRATAGPAWRGGGFEVPVVIAHVSGRRDVLRREVGVVSIDFADGAVAGEGDFTLEYELRVAGPEALEDDRILFGLRPTRAELNYLRNR